MARIEFNTDELFRAVFGYVALPYPLGNLGGNSISGSLKSIKGGILNKNDVFGKPYFMPIRLNGVWLPNNPVMSLSREKRIVSTAISGKSGTQKELISADDYQIKIRGFAINFESNDYPYDDVESIKKIQDIDKALDIYSDLCTLFDINNVVLKSFSLPEIVGVQNVQPYEFSLISDDDFDVIIK